MGLNRYRNKLCQCGSGMKFKFCCLQNHYEQQTGLVTRLAKGVQEKMAKYWRKRYKGTTIGCDIGVGKDETVRRVVRLTNESLVGIPHPCNDVNFKKTEGKIIT